MKPHPAPNVVVAEDGRRLAPWQVVLWRIKAKCPWGPWNQRNLACKRVAALEDAMRNYLREHDTPVPDFTLRAHYRNQMRELLAETENR